MDFSTELQNAIRDGIRDGVRQRLSASNYGNPLDAVIKEAVAGKDGELRSLLDDGIKSCLDDAEFCNSIKAAVRQSLAKTLVQKFGGELEKQVNALKSDPLTRARITLAIEEIVASKTA